MSQTGRLTADQIMSFLQDVTERITFIEEASFSKYQIETDMGSSFAFEIVADTQEEAALAYFWHVHHVLSYPLGFWTRCVLLRRLGLRGYREQERKRVASFARVEEYALLNHLRPPPPPEDADDA